MQESDELESIFEELSSHLESRPPVAEGADRLERVMWVLRACGDLYRQCRADHPDVELDADLMTVLRDLANSANQAGGAFLQAVDEESPEPGWFGDAELCVAAARMSSSGSAEDVLIAGVLLVSGYGNYSGIDGRGLDSAYTWLLPAIVSATCSAEFFKAFHDELVDIPPVFFETRSEESVWLEPSVRALVPGLSDAERRDFLEEYHVSVGDQSVFEAMWAAAQALGIDPEALDPGGEGPQIDWEDVLMEAVSWEPGALQQVQLANLIYWAASESCELLKSSARGADFDTLYPWTLDWYPSQAAMSAQWPPNREFLCSVNGADAV